MNPSTSMRQPPLTTAAIGSRGRLAKLMAWLFLSSVPILVLVQFKPQLMAFWRWLIVSWADALGLSLLSRLSLGSSTAQWDVIQDGSLVPTSTKIVVTALLTLACWLISGQLSDRFHPLKIAMRVMCLIQWSACLFFAGSPASFPYTIGKHLNALISMGYGFMLAMGPMLTLGWGVLNVPWRHKILAPLLFLAFFALMLPHKALLHMWLLEHFSLLFMPLLFLVFGALLDLWIFVALYAFLASFTPAHAQALSPIKT